MKLYRISDQAWAGDPISGKGAELYGGRFNPKGTACLYTSQTPELAVLESSIRLARPFTVNWHLIILEVDETLIKPLDERLLPSNWRQRRFIGMPIQTLLIDWLLVPDSLGISVPSALVPLSRNVLLNPAYPDYKKLVNVLRNEPFTLS